jgi:peptide chain release factor 1
MQRHDAILTELTETGRPRTHLTKELNSLQDVVRYGKLQITLQAEVKSYQAMMKDTLDQHDEDLFRDCETELQRLQAEITRNETNIVNAILPKDDEDCNSDAIIEIRAGTGGDEAALFAKDLWDCLLKTVPNIKSLTSGWKVDVLHASLTDLGGIREGSLLISGNSTTFTLPNVSLQNESNDSSSAISRAVPPDINAALTTVDVELGPYGFFKFESGVHRVQRIPVNATRIHTSACSIAVLPSTRASDADATELLPLSELKIETMRSSGAGGQHVNTTDSAVRITHIPTGIQAAIQDERSQHKNKAKALKLIAARVRDLRRLETEQKLGSQRSLLMGGGDRSERIRTYNFAQDRITDHRAKVSLHGISNFLNCSTAPEDGLVISFLPYLQLMRREELLLQLEEEVFAVNG